MHVSRTMRRLGALLTTATLLLVVGAAAPVALADPPGNDGTVKVDGVDFDSHPDNQPHVGCSFQIDYTGFDSGQSVSHTFSAHPPTGTGTLYSNTLVLDEAGAGSETIDLSSALQAYTPHATKGYHVQLDVSTGEPGDQKHKTFWVTGCEPPPPPPPPETFSICHQNEDGSYVLLSDLTEKEFGEHSDHPGDAAPDEVGGCPEPPVVEDCPEGQTGVPPNCKKPHKGTPPEPDILGRRETKGPTPPPATAVAGPSLPFTGIDPAPFLGLSGLLMAAGAGCMLGARKKK